MWVKFRTRCAGPSGNFSPDEVAEVGDEFGKALVEGRFAESVKPAAVVVKVPPAESAVLTPAEKAAMDPPVPRVRRNQSRDM